MSATEAHLAADVLVIFGITGDLAKVKTFHSLYRLEALGLLDLPIVGVAVDDWSVQQLREHARAAIIAAGGAIDEGVFKRLTDRLAYVQGDLTHAETYARVRDRRARRILRRFRGRRNRSERLYSRQVALGCG